LKTRTHEEAARQGRIGHCTVEDMEASRHMANDLIYSTGLAQIDCVSIGWALVEYGYLSFTRRQIASLINTPFALYIS
jgi:hypothetical protein